MSIKRAEIEESREETRGKEPESPLPYRPANGSSTAESLLDLAGTWAGDDLEECLRHVYETRTPVRF
jgi:hypothetical protein